MTSLNPSIIRFRSFKGKAGVPLLTAHDKNIDPTTEFKSMINVVYSLTIKIHTNFARPWSEYGTNNQVKKKSEDQSNVN